jgi:diguanylate cyclase (GGDEF)-like protein/putative nucleotidyltransferase with HDIG domain
MPPKAKLYCAAVSLAGLAVGVLAMVAPGQAKLSSMGELLAFLVLAAFLGSRKVQLMRGKALEQMGSMSLGSAITFAAILHFGPSLGVLIGCVSTISACIFPKFKQTIPQFLFNIALTAIASWEAGVLFFSLNKHSLQVTNFESFTAVAAASLAYFAINTGGVSFIISLVSGEPAYTLWRKTFMWTAPGYLAGASISLLAVMAFKDNVGAVLMVAAPAAYLTYQSYATYTARAEEREQHIKELQAKKAQLADLYLATIKSLALAIDAKDQYTHQHILRVQRYSLAIAGRMGLDGPELEGLATGALLHDIGKLGVPEYVLLKPGRLTEEEFEKIKKHPEIGAAILDPVEFPWPVVPVVKSHHERWDGTGYPEGLKGEEIPLIARILAVADVYDAMTSHRSYRNAWPHDKVIEIITTEAGSHFDPIVVDAFLDVVDETIAEMAKDGSGPLLLADAPPKTPSKADQAALHIQRASSEIWALYEVAQTTSCSLGLQETLEILARKLQAIFPSSACLFMLRSEDLEHLQVRATVGVNREFFEGCQTLSTESTSLDVLRRGYTYMGEYDTDDIMLAASHTTEWLPLKSAMIVPVTHQGEPLGTINIYHPEVNVFGAQDKLLLESIAERAGMAIYSGLLYERTRSDAVTDPLTGLYNLRYLTQYVEDRCSRDSRKLEKELGRLSLDDGDANGRLERRNLRKADSFALLCLDLDSFKPINDNFGHQKGDQVLQDLSSLFRTVVREADIIARYGGDEFLIVLQGAGPAEAEELAVRLQEAVECYEPGLNHSKLGPLRLSVSIGYACYPLHAEDCASLLSAADAHMYRHKAERKLGRLAERHKPSDAYKDSDDEPRGHISSHFPEDILSRS